MKKEKLLYPLSNPLMFATVMNDKERCRQLIERVLPERKIKELRFPGDEYLEVEKTILNGLHYKSVRLDVLFEDESAWYDIEMQITDERNIPKRARYYHSMIDTHSLMKGKSYNDLKPTYVIFICMFDIFNRGEAVYNFEMVDTKNNLLLNDGRYTIILNTGCSCEKIPNELKPFFDYLNDREIDDQQDMFIESIHREVLKHNHGEELITLMTFEEELKNRYNYGLEAGLEKGLQEGLQEGRREAMLETAKNLKNKGIAVEVICECTGLSEEEVEKL